jgi:hypothetical protein
MFGFSGGIARLSSTKSRASGAPKSLVIPSNTVPNVREALFQAPI